MEAAASQRKLTPRRAESYHPKESAAQSTTEQTDRRKRKGEKTLTGIAMQRHACSRQHRHHSAGQHQAGNWPSLCVSWLFPLRDIGLFVVVVHLSRCIILYLNPITLLRR